MGRVMFTFFLIMSNHLVLVLSCKFIFFCLFCCFSVLFPFFDKSILFLDFFFRFQLFVYGLFLYIVVEQ